MDAVGMTGTELSAEDIAGLHRPEPVRAGAWRDFGADLARYRAYQPGKSWLYLMLLNFGLWALLQYRVTRGLRESGLPVFLKSPLLIVCVLWQKIVEILTGIELPNRAQVGPGLWIGHFGGIIIHQDAVIGAGCNLSQGVTIGISGRGRHRGVPVLGARIFIGANAVIAGKLTVGDDALIAANALVTRDVAPSAVMLGNPARTVSFEGSAEYLSPAIEPLSDRL